ncbi:restriction endonuclease [Pseudomonas sp. SG20052]|uniref:restriction endonuclease n=1 Tax=Pseudomonas sp. SG20052 TaxID=3074147 RepID=UPI00287F445B|nr:restriction endonuclease [Pseudomonas sp. SG20052]WNF58516.1 restriction endonuclease [Pseudomonas sp. SG20052]
MKKILDYSETTPQSGHQDRGKAPNENEDLFFDREKDGICPFCKIHTQVVHTDHQLTYPDWLDGGEFDIQENVKQCSNCGWWRIRCDKVTTVGIDARSFAMESAILKSYELSSKQVPIEVLRKHLAGSFDDVIHIHDRNMEKLVQSVFREHYSCDVEHVGKSHDGGIDLILVNADSPIVVQVKRRKSLDHIEGVAGVREFLGATVLQMVETVYMFQLQKNSRSPLLKLHNKR